MTENNISIQLRINENTLRQLDEIAKQLNTNRAKAIKHLILNDYISILNNITRGVSNA